MAAAYRVAAPSIRIVPWAALASSSLFPPLAAVVVVASHVQRKEYFYL